MPALINIWGHFLLGIIVAHLSRAQLLRSDSRLSPALLYLLGFQGLLSIPVCTYLSHFFPHWTLLYFFDPQIFTHLYHFPGTLSFALVSLNTLAAFAGFFIYRRALNLQQRFFWLIPLVLSSICILIIFFNYHHRIFFVGNHTTYWQGDAHFYLAHISGWLGVSMLAAAALLISYLHRKSILR